MNISLGVRMAGTEQADIFFKNIFFEFFTERIFDFLHEKRFFHVVESKDKITLYNDQFVVWVVPEKIKDEPTTIVLIALSDDSNDSKLHLELAFADGGQIFGEFVDIAAFIEMGINPAYQRSPCMLQGWLQLQAVLRAEDFLMAAEFLLKF